MMPGRIRLKLAQPLAPAERKEVEADLKLSPQVKTVRLTGKSLVIEHVGADEHPWSLLERWFPDVVRMSDAVDMSVARLTETPEVNKLLPLGVLAFAIYKGIRDGALMAGESSFAIMYIAFDLYWKFQQENVTRKIQKGLTQQQLGQISKAS